MRIQYLLVAAISLCLVTPRLMSVNDGIFYRVPLWRYEPHTGKPFLTSWHIASAGASAHDAFDENRKKVPLLSLFGPESLQDLGIQSSRSDLSFSGNFSLAEVQIDGYLNFDHGFFTHFYLPVRSISIDDILPVEQDDLAQRAFNDLLALLKKHGKMFGPLDKSGIGDVALQIGWAGTCYDCGNLDFIDLEVEGGVLFPTASECDPNTPCDILPLGTASGFGFPASVAAAFGILDWLTFGTRIRTLYLVDTTGLVKLRNSFSQGGFIRLQSDNARIHNGFIWDGWIYVKADHFIRGLSTLLAYRYGQKVRSSVSGLSRLNPEAANSDPLLSGWDMDTLHVVIEYDWSDEDRPSGPRLAFEYNYLLRGRRVFNAPTIGGYFAVELEWRF